MLTGSVMHNFQNSRYFRCPVQKTNSCLKKLQLVELARLHAASKFALFSVSVTTWFEKKLILKSKPTRKLKHANSILESFEHLSQMSSTSILISSYTVSKLVRFLRPSAPAKYTVSQKKHVTLFI